jgi:hypothetical protein
MTETKKLLSQQQANRDSDSLNSSAHTFLSHHTKVALFLLTSTILVIAIALGLFIQNQSLKAEMGLPTFKLPWTQATCTYNGQEYQIGESVPSVDGCNSCSCDESGQIACTEMACPEKSDAPLENSDSDWKIFTDPMKKYFFMHPASLIPNTCLDGVKLFPLDSENISGKFCETPPFGTIQLTTQEKPFTHGFSNNEAFEIKSSTVTQNGITFAREEILKLEEAPGPDFAIYLTFVGNNTYYRFATNDVLYEPILDQILTTFAFTNAQSSFTGTLRSYEWPADDPMYHYLLDLDQPYFDELNAQGPRDVSEILVVPADKTIDDVLQTHLNQKVAIEGEIEWGLGETRHLKATQVVAN